MSKKTFVREATGLVKEISGYEVLFYNIAQINIGIGLAYVLLFLPSFYPGSSVELSVAITTFGVLPFALVYAFIGIVYPRSGADYVFTSRTIGGFVGFVTSFNFVVWELFYVGWTGWAFSNLGLSPFFSLLGYTFNSATFEKLGSILLQPTPSFVVGLLSILGFGALLMFGRRTYFRYQTVSMVLGMLSLVLMGALLAISSKNAFISAFNSFSHSVGSSLSYNAVIQQASSTGYPLNVPFSLKQTLFATPWPFLALAITMMSVSFAGEVKSPAKSQLFGIVGAQLISASFFIVLSYFMISKIGYQFLGSISYLYYTNASAYTLPTPPYFQVFAVLLTNNAVLRLIILLGMVVWSALWIPVIMLYCVRTIFAWSFDKMAPVLLASVSEKHHTPIYSSLVSILGGIFFLLLVVYTPYFATLVGMLGLALTILVVCVAAMLYPFKKKEEFEGSQIRYRVFNAPLITLLGALGCLFLVFMIYRFSVDSVVAANTPTNEIAVLSILVAGVVYYFVAKSVRKRQGVNLELVFREIPPD